MPEDRKRSGLLLDVSIAGNISLPDMARPRRRPASSSRSRRPRNAERQRASLNIRTPSVANEVGALSGGNQQKVVLAKWLSMKPRVIIFDEPTRGIDVGAKSEIYALMRALADQGVAILMISSDMEEVIGVSDRIAVMHEGAHQRLSRPAAVQRAQCPAAGAWATGVELRGGNAARKTSACSSSSSWSALSSPHQSAVPVADQLVQHRQSRSACSASSRIGQAFVIITGGIELSVGSVIALLGVLFVD